MFRRAALAVVPAVVLGVCGAAAELTAGEIKVGEATVIPGKGMPLWKTVEIGGKTFSDAPPTNAQLGGRLVLRATFNVIDPGDPAIWFVLLQGSLDGPFTRAQLGELVRRGALEKTATTRRRGDASWKPVRDVLA